MPSSSFPGEKYLLEQLPEHEAERFGVVIKLLLAVAFWGFVMPLFLAREETLGKTTRIPSTETAAVEKEETNEAALAKDGTKNIKSENRQSRKRAKKSSISNSSRLSNGPSSLDKNTVVDETEVVDVTNTHKTTKVIDWKINLLCCFSLIVNGLYILLMSSPDNYYTSRTVYEVPLFTPAECAYLVDMAERVAFTNYQTARNLSLTDSAIGETLTTNLARENVQHNATVITMNGFLQPPHGWQKTRHLKHPTTDLNVVIDPFTKEDRTWIQQKLDARLAPALERIFGIPSSSIRANDIFLVRYDGDRQASLSRHTDDGSITFSALLSSDFEGGGTRYWNRFDGDPHEGGEPFAYVLPQVGMMTTFPAVIEHEGVQTTKGKRYLMIGFLAVDQIDPWTKRPTGLSWFSSWLSLNWATVKLKEGSHAAWKTVTDGLISNKWTKTWEAGKMFQMLQHWMQTVGDFFYPHRFVVLVNSTSADDYLHALDKQYQLLPSQRASWFSGQQIKVDIDGTFFNNWVTRDAVNAKFENLDE